MKLSKTATLVISLYDLKPGESFRDIQRSIEPGNVINHLALPQTSGDQIWDWYEFATEQEKLDFLANVPSKFIASSFTQADLDQWS
jgi:hypothetical protein